MFIKPLKKYNTELITIKGNLRTITKQLEIMELHLTPD
jgi:hypothetical protein